MENHDETYTTEITVSNIPAENVEAILSEIEYCLSVLPVDVAIGVPVPE